MSFLSWLLGFRQGRLTPARAVQELAERLRVAAPELAWDVDVQRPGVASIGLPGRWLVTLEDGPTVVGTRIAEPGQPGEDDPPFLMRASYDVTNLAHHLSWRARIEPGTVALHALRKGAVYQVRRSFTDH